MNNKHPSIERACHIVNDPYGFIASADRNEKRYLGYDCVFVPVEIIHAAGFTPVRLFGKPKGMGTDQRIPSQCCDFLKGLIQTVNEGELSFLEGAVFGFCCDTLKAGSSILESSGQLSIYTMGIPTKFRGKPAKTLLVKEIEIFKRFMENRFDFVISSDRIKKSIEQYRKQNRLLQKLKSLKTENPDILSGHDVLNLLSAGYFIPVEDHILILEELVESVSGRVGSERETAVRGNKKILLSGLVNCNYGLVKKIENLGVSVVEDDLCEGSRSLFNPKTGPVSSGTEWAEMIADRILSLYCPVKIETKSEYADVLIEKYKNGDADGIVFIFFKFCDPHYLEYTIARQKLMEKKIPFLVLESSLDGDNWGQIETRIEAFIENI